MPDAAPACDPPSTAAAHTPQPQAPTKFVLVIGTGFANAHKRRISRMIGTTLAESGLGLICGNSTGVDRWVARGFCAAKRERGEPIEGALWQISLGFIRFFARGGWPFPGYQVPEACKVRVYDVQSWIQEATARCDAAVMVGGGGAAMEITRNVIDRGKPVFPLPFNGGLTGNSDFIFQDILRTWDGFPVPGLTRTQFLRLAEPWVNGTGPLRNLLYGTLATQPDIFISYRRSDAPAAAGRIADDLSECFGQKRVFLDVQGIAPSGDWDQVIDNALVSCKVGIVVIGRHWLAPKHAPLPAGLGAIGGSASKPSHATSPQKPSPDDALATRLHDPDDVVRSEIKAMIDQKKPIFPILVEGARLPDERQLPRELHELLRYQALTLDNSNWLIAMSGLLRTIDEAIRQTPTARAEHSVDSSILPQ